MPTWAWVLLIAAAASAGLFLLTLALWRVHGLVAWRVEWAGGLAFPREGLVRLKAGFPFFRRTWEWTKSEKAEETEKPRDDEDDAPSAPPSAPPSPPDPPQSAAPSPPPRAPDAAPSRSGREPPRAPEAPPPQGGPDPDPAPSSSSSSSAPQRRKARHPNRRKARDPQRFRRALFRLATDGKAWGLMARYGLRVLRLAHRLLHPRIRLSLGHPDPVLLGRAAGYWHAAAPMLPRGGDTTMEFRFQDRRPSLRVHAEGGFSALSLLAFVILSVVAFPVLRLAARAWRGWKEHALTGWRAFVYRRVQGE